MSRSFRDRESSDMWLTRLSPAPPRRTAITATVGCMKFHDITMTSITGDQVDFADYEGKLALVVNVASA